jgi:hypothetical protein
VLVLGFYLPSAVLSTAMDSFPEHNPKQASHTKPPIEWNVDDLVGWIKEKRPHLLNDDEIEKLRTAESTGEVFLLAAGNRDFFKNGCNLPAGTAVVLANLARELAEEDSKLLSFMSCTRRRQQADTKSKLLSFIPRPPHRLQANNLTCPRNANDAFKRGIKYKPHVLF